MMHFNSLGLLATTMIALAFPAIAKPPIFNVGAVIGGVVLQVYDGDGVWLDDHDGNPRTYLAVRLFGIDAPEWNSPHGQASKRFLSELIKGRRVRCVVQSYDHKYDRPVAICLNDAGKDLSCASAWAGHAIVTDTKYEPCDRVRLLLRDASPAPPPF